MSKKDLSFEKEELTIEAMVAIAELLGKQDLVDEIHYCICNGSALDYQPDWQEETMEAIAACEDPETLMEIATIVEQCKEA